MLLTILTPSLPDAVVSITTIPLLQASWFVNDFHERSATDQLKEKIYISCTANRGYPCFLPPNTYTECVLILRIVKIYFLLKKRKLNTFFSDCRQKLIRRKNLRLIHRVKNPTILALMSLLITRKRRCCIGGRGEKGT